MNGWIEIVNSLGIDVGKKKCRAALKDERGDIIREFFSNNNEGISTLIRSASHYGKCTAVLESTGNMWYTRRKWDRYHIGKSLQNKNNCRS